MLTKPTGSYVKLFPSALRNILGPFKSLFWFLSLSLTSVSAKHSRKTLQCTSLGIKWLKPCKTDKNTITVFHSLLYVSEGCSRVVDLTDKSRYTAC